MMTLSLYPRYRFKKTTQSLIFSTLLLSVSSYSAYSVDAYETFKDMPEGVTNYLKKLPTISIEKEMNQTETACEIVQFLKRMSHTSFERTGEKELLNRIEDIIKIDTALTLVLVGYPFKSTNTDLKVLSEKVDMGEFIGFLTLNHICQQIQTLYKPGAKVLIYSDGLAYTSLLDISESTYKSYQKDLNTLSAFFNEYISIHYPQDLDLNLKEKAPFDQETFQDITHFMEEELNCTKWKEIFDIKAKELLPDMAEKLKNKMTRKKAQLALNKKRNELIKDKSRALALEASQLSYVFGQAVKNDLKNVPYIRLSIHPHQNISEKLTIPVIYGSRGTPWHLTPLLYKDGVQLQKKKEIEKYFKYKKINFTTNYYQTYSLKLAYSKIE
jgi:pyoverdine/dityrosine biosynthesis protein Dit1